MAPVSWNKDLFIKMQYADGRICVIKGCIGSQQILGMGVLGCIQHFVGDDTIGAHRMHKKVDEQVCQGRRSRSMECLCADLAQSPSLQSFCGSKHWNRCRASHMPGWCIYHRLYLEISSTVLWTVHRSGGSFLMHRVPEAEGQVDSVFTSLRRQG